MISTIYFWIKNTLMSIRFGQTPKYIRIGNDSISFDIPCHKAVVDYLNSNKEVIYEFIDLKKYSVVNQLVFGYLKDYVDGIDILCESQEDYSEVINYIFNNLE